MRAAIKWGLGAIAALIALILAIFVGTRGGQAAAALVTEDSTRPSQEIAGIRLHLQIVEDAPDAHIIVVLHGGAGGDVHFLLGLSDLCDTHRVVFYEKRARG